MIGENQDEVGGEQLADLKLHKAVLNETLRLRPPVPILQRTVLKDTVLLGIPLKQGQVVDGVMAAPSLSEEHFVNALQFLPDRWLDGSLNDRHPFCFMPFSGGKRNCIGAKLAMQEATIILFHLVRRFRMFVLNPDEVVIAFKGTAEPRNMKAVFEKR